MISGDSFLGVLTSPGTNRHRESEADGLGGRIGDLEARRGHFRLRLLERMYQASRSTIDVLSSALERDLDRSSGLEDAMGGRLTADNL